MKKHGETVSFVLLFIAAAAFPQAAAQGAKEALGICMNTVIPSVFPLMFASMLLVRADRANIFGRILEKPVKFLFGLPGCAGKALTAAVLGGYPAGAAAVKTLCKNGEISRKQAADISLIAVCAGPSFVIGAVGCGIYSSTSAGVMLLCVQMISVLIIGIIMRFFFGKHETETSGNSIVAPNDDIFVSSALDSARSMMSVCTFVVLFGAIGGILSAAKLNHGISCILKTIKVPDTLADSAVSMLLEVSSGCIQASKVSIEAVAFVLGFGGLSVHFQIFSILKELGVNKALFVILRFMQGIICAVLAHFGAILLPDDAVETAAVYAQRSMPSVTGCVCLVIMCFMLLFCVPTHLTKDN